MEWIRNHNPKEGLDALRSYSAERFAAVVRSFNNADFHALLRAATAAGDKDLERRMRSARA
ncbi:hypothetical protein [Nannocystis pusilla]|uniref:hypothetical protein n=1 Tax=Nannocystis pusilla TaxID=889268 RepID=UPI003B7A6825